MRELARVDPAMKRVFLDSNLESICRVLVGGKQVWRKVNGATAEGYGGNKVSSAEWHRIRKVEERFCEGRLLYHIVAGPSEVGAAIGEAECRASSNMIVTSLDRDIVFGENDANEKRSRSFHRERFALNFRLINDSGYHARTDCLAAFADCESVAVTDGDRLLE